MFDWSSLGAILGNYGTNAGANPVGPLATQAPVGAQSPGLFGSLGDWIKKNPEQFAMGLDMAGQAFDPNNVAAGVGTKLAQASMMNKAAKEAEAKQAKDKKAWHEDLLSALGGHAPSAPGEGGLSSFTTKKDANGLTITATGDVGSKLARPEDLNLSNPGNVVKPLVAPSGGGVNLAGLTPEQMQSVIATRQGYDKMAQQDQATELNRAKTIQGIQDANDMIDVGGIKIPRAQAPQMISALANKQYQEGKLSNEDYMLETEKAYKTALTNAYIASHRGDIAKANKYQEEALILQQKLGVIQKLAKGGEVTDAERTILGMTSPVAKPAQTYSQASTLLKNEMVTTDFMGKMQDPAAQKRYAAAEGIMSDLWKSGRRDTGIVNEARKSIYRAEQFCVNKYLEAGVNGDKKEQKKILDSFINQFEYIPPKIEEMIGEE